MKHLQQRYQEFESLNLLRSYEPSKNNYVDFTTSDYLNISHQSNLELTILNGFREYGLGAKGSNAVCGYTELTQEFEEAFAKFVNYPVAIFFSSGYMANLAIFSTLFSPTDTLFADKNIHASIIDGIKLSQAKLKRFTHQNFNHLSKIYNGSSFIISEGIFSTYGDITNLTDLVSFSENIVIDEAHSFGVLGQNGQGSINHHRLNYKNIPIAIYPLGKAFGSVGAMVCTTIEIASFIRQFARNYIYTTAIPPMILAANIQQLDNLQNANIQREKLHKNINYFNKLTKEYQLEITNYDLSPIKGVIFKSNQNALTAKQTLAKNNFNVSLFRYPTVPKNKPMLRFSLHSNNTFEQIQKALILIMETKK